MFGLPTVLRNLLGTHSEIFPDLQPMPLFITGAMRSGTTLLVNKITQHPQLLKVGSELNEIWTAIGGANCMDTCEYRNEKHADFHYSYQMSGYFFRFIGQSKSVKRHLMRALNIWKMQEGRIFYDWDQIIPVNKSTHLINKIKYVHSLFPESKFIFIIRDIHAQSSSLKFHFEDIYQRTGNRYMLPEDANDCWSVSKTKNEGRDVYPGDFSTIPRMWMKLNLLAIRELKALPDGQHIIIQYADLVNDQEAILRKIFDFLNLDPRHHQKEIQISKTFNRYRNTTTTGNPLDKWKSHLSANEKQIIETIIRENQADYSEIQKATTA